MGKAGERNEPEESGYMFVRNMYRLPKTCFYRAEICEFADY